MSRRLWVILHRYAGLATAVFLVITGLTGSAIAFYPQLDAWLNPTLYRTALRRRERSRWNPAHCARTSSGKRRR